MTIAWSVPYRMIVEKMNVSPTIERSERYRYVECIGYCCSVPS